MLEKKQRMRAGYLLAALGALVAGVVLLGCNPTPAPPPAKLQFDVRREQPVVRTGAAAPLSPLTDSAFHSLPDGNLVTTDASGEALLQSVFEGSTCRIYLFFDGGLRKAGCPGSTFTGSSTTCLEERSAVYRGCSGHVIMTPSGEAQVVGSWVWVTYLPERQLTLIAVLEGKVLFRPVLEFDSRKLGDAIPIGAQEFLYTAPDAMLEELAGLPARTVLPLEQLPPLIDELGLDPWTDRARDRADQDDVPFPESPQEVGDETPPSISRLSVSPADPTTDDQVTISVAARDAEAGVERIEIYVNQKLVQRCTSAKCSVTLGPFSSAGDVQVQVLAYDQAGNQSSQEGSFAVAESARSGLILRSGGGPFKDSRVQTAVLHAAPWADMVAEVFSDPNLPVLTELDGQEIDARKMDYDPDRALEMLAEAGYPNGFGAALLVPQGDEQLVAMGDWLASILGKVGVDAGFNEVPADAARGTMAKYVAAGEAVLWLSRQ